jgi:hypothetical protein
MREKWKKKILWRQTTISSPAHVIPGGRELCGASNKMIKGLVLSLKDAARFTQKIWASSIS